MGDQPAAETLPVLRLKELRAENFRRLKLVHLTIGPGQSVVEITAKNGAGKTSLLDAFAVAIGGARFSPTNPIHQGADRAEIIADLGEYRVTRTFTEKGTYLKVENAEGASFKSPQALLDRFYDDLTFDPLAFRDQPRAQQRQVGLRLAGLTELMAQLDHERTTAFEARTDTNRKLDDARGSLAGYQGLEGEAPQVPDVEALLRERRGLEDQREAYRTLCRQLEGDQAAAARASDEVSEAREDLERAQKYLADAEAREKTVREQLTAADAAVEAATCPDTSEIDARIASAGETRDRAKLFEQRDRLTETVAELDAKSKALTDEIADVDRRKTEAVKTAPLPIEGLGFDAEGVTYQGFPLQECSEAEQLRVSVAIAMRLNQRLRVLRITNGSLLDEDSFAQIAEMAGEQGYVVLIERVDWPKADADGQVHIPMGVYIEDGEVAAINGTPITRAPEEPETDEAGAQAQDGEPEAPAPADTLESLDGGTDAGSAPPWDAPGGATDGTP